MFLSDMDWQIGYFYPKYLRFLQNSVNCWVSETGISVAAISEITQYRNSKRLKLIGYRMLKNNKLQGY